MPRAVDHLVIPAHDLGALADLYRRLGFQVGARNRHPWGTENHIIQFDGAFLELIGLGEGFAAPPRDAPEHGFAGFVARYLEAREGLAMLVLRSADAEADRRAFAAQGLGALPRFDFARSGRRPNGEPVNVAFSLAFAASPAWPETGFFVCQQHFPENFWNAAMQVHPNGALGVAALEFAHPEPEQGLAFLRHFLAAAETPPPDGYLVEADGTRIVVKQGPLPAMTGLAIRVGELGQCRSALEAGGVAYADEGRALSVAPEAALGVALSFVPE